jgi:hypothetical protein
MSDYENTVAAIATILSSASTQHNRKEAEGYLQSVRDSPTGLKTLVQIVTCPGPEPNEHIRALSLTIVQNWIRHFWDKVPPNMQLDIRQEVVSMIVSVTANTRFPKSVLRKLSSILADVVERQFPNQWQTFVEDVMEVWRSSPQQDMHAVVIVSLENVISDCVDSDFSNTLTSTRRQDILNGLTPKVPMILETTFSYMCALVQEYMEQKSSAGSEAHDASRVSQIVDLFGETLKMVVPVIAFMKPDEVLKPEHDFSIVIELFSDPMLQLDSVQLLEAVARKPLSYDLFRHLLEKISKNHVTSLPDDEYDSLVLQRTYASVIFGLLSQNMSHLSERDFVQDAGAQELLHRHICLLVSLLRQPSRQISADVVLDWVKIFREKAARTQQWVGEISQFLLQGEMMLDEIMHACLYTVC